MLRLRALVATALLTALTVTVPSAAHAVPAADVTWSPVAPRHAGDGYPALGAPVDPWLTQVAADGAILFYDRTASRLRRIDPTTGVITALAGDGSPAAYCSPTYGADARTIAVPALQSVAAAANGDVVGIMAATYYCGSPGVIRLDHTDHQWHLVAQQPSSNDQYTLGYGGFGSVAVGPDGTVYVTDGFGHRVLAYAPGSAADAMGQVVAGTGTAGSAGDGGPATAAEVHAPRLAIGPGAVFLADGTSGSETTVVRRIDLTTGVITRVAGTGNPYAGAITGADPLVGLDPLSADLTIEAFNVDPVSGLVALGLLRRSAVNSDIQHDLLAFAPGGTLVGVRTGLDVSNYTDPGIAVQHTGSRVLAYGQGELRAWRTSGADQGTAGSLVAGLGLSGSSASGVPLEDEFPGELTSIAASSTGAVALSGADGVRTLASLTPSSAVTVVSSERANAVDYASDGALWWARDTSTPALVRKMPGGASVVVAGGGAGALVDGAVATSVALPTIVDVAADSSTGTTYFLAQSGADNPTYVGARFPQLWSLTTADGKLHLVAGDGTSNRLVVDGQSAATAALGDANAVAVDTAHVPIVSTDSGVFRVSGGAMHGPFAMGFSKPIAVTASGTIISNGQVLASDGSWSGVAALAGYQLAAPLPDGTWVAATDSTAGSLLVRSDVVTPESGLPSAQVSVQADEGALTVTVTPPAVPGLSVGITLSESPSSSFDVRLDDFITDGSTTPHIYVLRRYATPPGTMYDGPLRSTTAYRVAVVRTVQPSFRTGASAFAFGSPLVDTTAPPSPTGLTLSEPLRNYPTITLTPGDAPDVDHVLVCEEKGSAVPATPDDCIGRTDAGGSASVAPGAAAVDVPLTAVLDPGRYNPADERTFTAFTVDIQGNASAATSLTVPGASPTTSLGAVPGIEWAWDASTSSVLFRFRADPESAAIVAGTAPPATPAPPYGGLLSGRTWIAYNLVPGQTYTAAFYRWSSDSTHYTPTTVTFVAGTSSSDSATLIAPTTAAYAARPVIKVAVRRAVSSGTVGAASLAGMPVELWRRAAPSTTWVKIGTSTTGADGTASWTPSALGATSTFMALIPAQGYMYPSVVGSKAVVVGVRPIERASLSSSSTLLARSVRVGSTVPVTIRLAPRRTMVAWVQRYLSGRWRTVLITRTSSLGVLSYAFRPTSRGTTLLRVVTPATTTLLAGASNYVTVKAS